MVHQTVSPREREGSGDETEDETIPATMHYLLHNVYRYVYIRECMPICTKSPKVTITFICRSKIVVQEMYGLVHISDFESIKCGKVQSDLNLLYSN